MQIAYLLYLALSGIVQSFCLRDKLTCINTKAFQNGLRCLASLECARVGIVYIRVTRSIANNLIYRV